MNPEMTKMPGSPRDRIHFTTLFSYTYIVPII